jgi:hypothetical protein
MMINYETDFYLFPHFDAVMSALCFQIASSFIIQLALQSQKLSFLSIVAANALDRLLERNQCVGERVAHFIRLLLMIDFVHHLDII